MITDEIVENIKAKLEGTGKDSNTEAMNERIKIIVEELASHNLIRYVDDTYAWQSDYFMAYLLNFKGKGSSDPNPEITKDVIAGFINTFNEKFKKRENSEQYQTHLMFEEVRNDPTNDEKMKNLEKYMENKRKVVDMDTYKKIYK